MDKKRTDPLKAKLNAECLKRSKFGGCRMECELPGSKLGYCKTVWQAVLKWCTID